MIMSTQLVFRYFDSIGVKHECPSCGRNQWFIHENIEREGTGVVQIRADGVSKQTLTSSLLYVLVICQHCGFIRQYARPLIVQWAKERGEV